MESSRPKEKRKTKEHITPRNGNRHEKDEQKLNGIRKEGTGQSGLENAGRRPMLHWEYQALSVLEIILFMCELLSNTSSILLTIKSGQLVQ
ncbi:unnamed protein product [Schistosoma margrebowiei]|uniref:Uncharacterized protein n=1 Tax=Schistosoma margrebowiei TaxID=48269 RepID=A0A183MU44_9TREM|nr:unnamed protein product [Schistosoma margrebowiei]